MRFGSEHEAKPPTVICTRGSAGKLVDVDSLTNVLDVPVGRMSMHEEMDPSKMMGTWPELVQDRSAKGHLPTSTHATDADKAERKHYSSYMFNTLYSINNL